jgi:rhomboid protease GluP
MRWSLGACCKDRLVRQRNLESTLYAIGVIVAINFVAFLIAAISAGSLSNTTSSFEVRDGGLFGPAVEDQGEWWRVLTSGFLHVSWEHFFSNMVALLLLGLLLGNALGAARFVVIYVGSLITGGLFVLLFSPDSLTVGASGAVFGLAGAGIVVAWRQRRFIFLFLVAAWAITNLVFTLSTPGISVAGHFGGLIGGAVLGLLFAGRADRKDRSAEVIGPVAR